MSGEGGAGCEGASVMVSWEPDRCFLDNTVACVFV